jgi:site-specific recombinase XerD
MTASALSKQPEISLIKAEKLPLDQNPAAVYLASLKPTGRRTQQQALDTIARLLGAPDCFTLEWAVLGYQHTAAIMARLAETYKPSTANKMRVAMRRVLMEAWRLGQMTAEEYHRAADVKAIIGETLPAGRELAPGEITALMADCENDPTAAGARDAAIIALMYGVGLRREEVTTLDLSDYDSAMGRLIIRGKRAKERTGYLVAGAEDAMADWLETRGNVDGPLFLAVNKGGKVQHDRRLTPQAIYNLLAKRAQSAGVKECSPHDLRRTFVSDLLDSGADIAIVAKMAGHANVTTTARYDRRPELAKQKAAFLLHIPYCRR